MNWLKAFWRALLYFFAAYKAEQAAEHQVSLEIRANAENETQEAVNAVPSKTDSELTDIAVDSGLVQPEGSGRACRSWFNPRDCDRGLLPPKADGKLD
jgi:hypothetical protein